MVLNPESNVQFGEGGAEGVHPRPIDGPVSGLEAFFQSGNYGVAEIQTHTFADLLRQIMGNRILDVQSAAFPPDHLSGLHDFILRQSRGIYHGPGGSG